MSLTPKQARFVEEYLIDLNATQAAIRAGYSKTSAMNQGYLLLQHPDVQAAIHEGQKARSERTGISQDQAIKHLSLIGTAKITDVVSWDEGGVYFKNSKELTPEQAYLISEVSLEEVIKESPSGEELVLKRQKKIKFISDTAKIRALELLGKHLGLFKESLQITGLANQPVEVVYRKPQEPDVPDSASADA
jgi:phage terminase small subunit